MTAPSADGYEPLVNSAIASSEEFDVDPVDAACLTRLDEQPNYRAHRHIDYHQIGAYILNNLRLATCEDSYVDPAVFALTQEALRESRRDAALQQYAEEQVLLGISSSGDSENDTAAATAGVDIGGSGAEIRRVSFSSLMQLQQQQQQQLHAAVVTYDAPILDKPLPAVRFLLPVIEYRRYVKNRSRLVEYATEMLQRVYRGFHGRQLYRRAVRRRRAVQQLHASARRIQKVLIRRAERRKAMATRVQRVFRGWKWRATLKLMVQSSLRIQCCVRQRQARQRAAAERRRRAEGVPVVQMLGDGRLVTVCGRSFVLRVSRAGMNYRLLGVDAIRGEQYEGTVYKPKVLQLLQQHNERIVGDTVAARNERVMPWQHDRVVDIIISRLGLMPAINPLTVPLGARFAPQQTAPQRLVLVVDPAVSVDGTGAVQKSASAWQLNQTHSAPLLRMANEHFEEQQRRRHEIKLMAKPRRRNVNRATLGGKIGGLGPQK